MAVSCCLGFSSAIPADQTDEPFVFPTSSLPSQDNNSVVTTPASEGGSLPGSSASGLPSVPSLHNLSPHPPYSAYSVFSFKTRHGAIHSLALSGSSLFAGSASAVLLRFSNTSKPMMERQTVIGASDCGAVKSIVFISSRIFTAHQDGKIRIWKSSESASLHRVASLPTVWDKALRFLLPRNHVRVRRHRTSLWINHVDAVTHLAIRNGFLFSVSWDRTLKIWRISDCRCVESVRAHDDAVNALAVSAGGTVYTGSADTRIRVWVRSSANKHSLAATLETHGSAVNALVLSSDGLFLHSGACDPTILVWKKEDGPQRMTLSGRLHGHKGAVLCLAFTLGFFLFSGSADQTVRIWRRGLDNQYSSIAVLEGHNGPVKSLAVAPADPNAGGIMAYSGSLNGEVRAWQIWGRGFEGLQIG